MKLGKRFDTTLEMTFQLIEPDEGEAPSPIALVALAGMPIGTVGLESGEEDRLEELLKRRLNSLSAGLLSDAWDALVDEEDEDEDEDEDE